MRKNRVENSYTHILLTAVMVLVVASSELFDLASVFTLTILAGIAIHTLATIKIGPTSIIQSATLPTLAFTRFRNAL